MGQGNVNFQAEMKTESSGLDQSSKKFGERRDVKTAGSPLQARHQIERDTTPLYLDRSSSSVGLDLGIYINR